MRETMRQHQPVAARSSSRGAAARTFTARRQQQQRYQRPQLPIFPLSPSLPPYSTPAPHHHNNNNTNTNTNHPPISPLTPSFPQPIPTHHPKPPRRPYLAHTGLAYMPIPAPSPPTSHTADYILQPTVFDRGAGSAKQVRGQQQAERQTQRQRERDTERRPRTPFPARPVLPDVPDVPAGTASTASTAGGSGSGSSRDGRHQQHHRRRQRKPAPKPLSHVRTITPAVPWRREHPDLFHARPAAAAAGEERGGRSGSRLRFRETYRAGPPGEGWVFWGLVKGLVEGWREKKAPVGFLERLHIWKPKGERKPEISDSQSPMTARPSHTGSAAGFASSVQAPVPAPAMKQPPQSKKNPNVFNLANKQGYDPDRGTVFSDFMHPFEIGVDTPPMSPGPSNFLQRGKSISKKQYERTRSDSSFYCQGVPNEPEPLREMEGLRNTRHYSNPGNPFVGFEGRQRAADSRVSPGRERGQHKPGKEWWEFDSGEDEVPLSPLSHNRNANGKNGNSSAQGGYEAQYATRARDSGFYRPYHDILDDYS